MNDKNKSNKELINELNNLRKQVTLMKKEREKAKIEKLIA